MSHQAPTLPRLESHDTEPQLSMSTDMVSQQLHAAGVDTAVWGQGEAKTVDHLCRELNRGESRLVMDEDGHVRREVTVGRASIIHIDEEGRTYRLREDRQVFKDGRVRRRPGIAHELSEKLTVDEDPSSAMARGISEELGISDGVQLDEAGTSSETLPSPSYPGIDSTYHSIHFIASIDSEHFNPEGYIEQQADKDTYFVWEELQQDQVAEVMQMHSDHERLLAQLHPEDVTEAERQQVREKFATLVANVLAWAHRSGSSVTSIKRLGGGFKNPVVMLTTETGESFVAKGFTEETALETTIQAQKIFSELTEQDELRLIPRSEILNSTLFSSKAEGVAIKTLLEDIVASPEAGLDKAKQAFMALGVTLGYIHERSERPIDMHDSGDQQIIKEVLTDRDKLLRHIEELELASLIGYDQTAIAGLKERIAQLTIPEYVSIVHADAHLDQFFYGEGSVVEIVDYDDVREGDPMADIGRAIASLRDWCRTYKVDTDSEIELTRAIVQGYQKQRRESGLSDELEMDSMRVVCYELRLYMVKLKAFQGIREKLLGVGSELGLQQADMVADDSHDQVVTQYLSPEETAQFMELRIITSELARIAEYLTPVRLPVAA